MESHTNLLAPEELAQEIYGDLEAALERILSGEFDGQRRKRVPVKITGQ